MESISNISSVSTISLPKCVCEIQNAGCVIRFHDDYLEKNVSGRLERLNQIVSSSYKRRVSEISKTK